MTDSGLSEVIALAEAEMEAMPPAAPEAQVRGEQVLWHEDDGAIVYFDYDPDSDKTFIRRQTDVEPLLEQNKLLRNEGWDKRSEFLRIACYPPGAAWLFGQFRGMGDRWADIWKRGNEDALSDLVHERDFSGFRTVQGDFRANFRRRR